eukprot:COSAG01_NODE_63_length_29632_cov_270.650662_25_plen_91_part_00
MGKEKRSVRGLVNIGCAGGSSRDAAPLSSAASCDCKADNLASASLRDVSNASAILQGAAQMQRLAPLPSPREEREEEGLNFSPVWLPLQP